MKERLVRVASAGQLFQGALVECRGCECGRERCRTVLLRSDHVNDACDACGRDRCDTAWFEGPPCRGGWDESTCFIYAIQFGDLYLVDTGLQDEESPYVQKTKPREVVRGR